MGKYKWIEKYKKRQSKWKYPDVVENFIQFSVSKKSEEMVKDETGDVDKVYCMEVLKDSIMNFNSNL